MSWEIRQGDCLERLAEMDDRSVQCCITSPPYFGLRDYGTATWEGGDEGCDHDVRRWDGPKQTQGAMSGHAAKRDQLGRQDCECGATRIDSQIGLEPTPDEYVGRLVEVFREVRRVLRDDGVLWLNLGDSYSGSPVGSFNGGGFKDKSAQTGGRDLSGHAQAGPVNKSKLPGIKPKDLIGIPWMLAFALRADGWWLRSEVIWAKPNPMPESVTDRPTRAHEQVFLLTKSARYFYDADAVREQDSGRPSGNGFVRDHRLTYQNADGTGRGNEAEWEPGGGRNRRTVWRVATQPYAEAHFATFPPKLIEPMVLAGSRPEGAMDEPETVQSPLGERVGEDPSFVTGRAGMNRPRGDSEGTRPITRHEQRAYAEQLRGSPMRAQLEAEAGLAFAHYVRTDSSGARPIPDDLLRRWIDAGHLQRVVPPAATAADPSTSVVLDPFAGAGTTGVVALRHGRSFIGLELSAEYCELARLRIRDDEPLFNHASEVSRRGRDAA